MDCGITEQRALGEHVEDALGMKALEIVHSVGDLEVVLNAFDFVDERITKIVIDGVGDNHVALLFDRGGECHRIDR